MNSVAINDWYEGESSQNFDLVNENPGGQLERVSAEISAVYNYDYYENEIIEGQFWLIEGNDYRFVCLHKDWLLFQKRISTNILHDEHGNVLTMESSYKYLQSFAWGFVKGYYDYDLEIKKTTSIFPDSIVKAHKVFDSILTVHNGLNYKTRIEKKWCITHELYKRGGIETGKYYKAWYFIVNNYSCFEGFFKEYFIWFYKLVEKHLQDSNSHINGYKTALSFTIENYEIEKSKIVSPNSWTDLFKSAFQKYAELFIQMLKDADTYDENLKPLVKVDNTWTRPQEAIYLLRQLFLEYEVMRTMSIEDFVKVMGTTFNGLNIENLLKKGNESFGEQSERYRGSLTKTIKAILGGKWGH